MKKMIAMTSFSLLLGACAGPGGPPPLPGESAEAVQARLGRPTATYTDGDATVLEYATGPSGQYTWMARFGADGRLQTYQQVLSSEQFATVRIGKDDKASILHRFGRPVQQQHYALSDQDAWSYRYKEQGVWNSMMTIQFAPNGMVSAMMNGPDPDRESHRHR